MREIERERERERERGGGGGAKSSFHFYLLQKDYYYNKLMVVFSHIIPTCHAIANVFIITGALESSQKGRTSDCVRWFSIIIKMISI